MHAQDNILGPDFQRQPGRSGYQLTADSAVDKDGNVYFTDARRNRILKIDLEGKISIWKEGSNGGPGLRNAVRFFRARYHRPMELTGKKIAILVDNMYQEMEVWYPLYRFQEAGATVVTVGAKAGETYTSKLGYPVKSYLSYADAKAAAFDGVIVPGGYAPDHIRRHPAANTFVKEMDTQGKLVAAICHGPWVLCSAGGMLKGRKATSFFGIKDDVVNAGAHWTDAEVVVDRNLVTSRKPEDLPAFCKAAIQALAGAQK